MNYEQEYNASLEQAKKELKTCGSMDCDAARLIFRLFPQLRKSENEDDRIRKWLYDYIANAPNDNFTFYGGMKKQDALAWLEKQKERGPLTKEEEYTLHCIIEYLEDETCPSEWIGLLQDIYNLPYEKQKEDKEELVYRMNGLMQEYIKAGKDDAEKDHRYKCYKLFWDALEDSEFFKKKEEPIPTMNGDADLYFDSWNQQNNPTKRQCFEEGMRYAERLQKEQKHTLKFKIGDKVHLEGDEINILTITGIEEDRYLTDCAYGPILFCDEDNWDKVEQKPADLPPGFYFIDQDGNKYYSKEFRYGDDIKEMPFSQLNPPPIIPEQKPAEWSEEDEKMRKSILNTMESRSNAYGGTTFLKEIAWLKSLRLNLKKKNEDVAKFCSNEWSEEDEKMIELIRAIVFGSGKVSSGARTEIWDWLKSLRPSWKPSEEHLDALSYALQVMNTDLSPIAARTYQGLQEIHRNLRKQM